MIVFVACPLLAEDLRVATLPVRSRPPEELAEELRSMAGDEAAIAVVNGSLVVRATPTALAKIEKALAALDPPPRPLWIAVDQDTGPAITGRWSRASSIRGRGRVGQVDRWARGTGPAGRSPVGHGTGDPSRVLSVVRVARPAIPSELYPGPTRAVNV